MPASITAQLASLDNTLDALLALCETHNHRQAQLEASLAEAELSQQTLINHHKKAERRLGLLIENLKSMEMHDE